jgi:hypothetical protein
VLREPRSDWKHGSEQSGRPVALSRYFLGLKQTWHALGCSSVWSFDGFVCKNDKGSNPNGKETLSVQVDKEIALDASEVEGDVTCNDEWSGHRFMTDL